MDHGARGFEKAGLADVMAGFFLFYGTDDEFLQILVGGAAAHFTKQVVLDIRKEAGADLAVGGEADAAAGSAKGLGDGCDDTDFTFAFCARPIGKTISAGGRLRQSLFLSSASHA